jgi:hypothetical protein
MIVVLRVLAMYPSGWFWKKLEPEWPQLVRLSCLVQPTIQAYTQVKQLRERRARAQRKKTIADSAYRVLSQAGTPMHWSEIAEQVCQLDSCHSFTAGQVHQSLCDHSRLFTRVGNGTYALLEWGNLKVQKCPDMIITILKRENRPLPVETIFSRVSAIRPVTRNSVLMSLHMNLHFYRSLQGTFGLRSWLPETFVEQDPTTPEWLIEDPTSHSRVKRAVARGTDIKKYLSTDRLEPSIQTELEHT